MGEIVRKEDISNIEKYKNTFSLERIGSLSFHNNELSLLDHEIYFRKNYLVRFNEISTDYEVLTTYIGEGGEESLEWNVLNEVELGNDLRRSLTKGKLADTDIRNMLQDRRLVPSYNPLSSYFKELSYKGDGFIDKFSSYLTVDGGQEEQERWKINFKKSLVRTVKCALNDKYFNKHCIVLYSQDQHVGKTSYLRALCPKKLKPYYSENSLSSDKDSQVMLAKNFIINLDELASLTRLDINFLKTMLSKVEVNIRLPYAPKFSRMARKCSFFGSTNRTDFLMDSQNVRWLVFNVADIDKSYGDIDTEEYAVDIDSMWAEAYKLYKEQYSCELTKYDLEMNEINNSLYSATSTEREVIETLFEPATPNDSNKKGYYKMQPYDIFELAYKLLMDVNKDVTAKELNSTNFFREFKSIPNWKKVGIRLDDDKRVNGYHFFVRKEMVKDELF